VLVASGCQVRLHQLLDHHQPLLLEHGGGTEGELVSLEVGEGGAPPLGERLAQPLPGVGGVALGQRTAGTHRVTAESFHVESLGCDGESVARPSRLDEVGAHRLAQAGHGHLEAGVRVARCTLGPQLSGDSVAVDQARRLEGEKGE
jgi:hypothetical protein